MAYVYSGIEVYTCTGIMMNQYVTSHLSTAVSQLIVEFTWLTDPPTTALA